MLNSRTWPNLGVLLSVKRENAYLRINPALFPGGQRFAFRETDEGKEILAGHKDMERLFSNLTAEEDEVVTSGFADPW